MSGDGPPPVASTDPAPGPPWPEPPPGWRHDAPDPPEAFRVPWGVYDAVGLVLWTIVAQVLVAVPLQVVGYDTGDPLDVGLALVAVQLVTLGGVLGWLSARGSLTWHLLGPVRPRLRQVAVGLGVGLAGFVVATILPEMVRRGLDVAPPDRQEILDTVATTGARAWVLIVVAVALAPLVEEVVYRGLLFQSLRHRLGLWPALGLSSLTFAFVHLELLSQPLALGALLVLGVWLAAAFHRSGSLTVPVVAHAVFNGIAVALTLAIPV